MKGAVISSEANVDKNKLSTDTLMYSDIENKAEYSASSTGVNINTKPNTKYNEQGVTPNIGVTAKGDADSTTKSAISSGAIEVRSNPNQDLSTLSRDTTNSLSALGKIFDKKTVQEQQELAKVFGEVAYEEVGNIAKRAYDKAVKDKDQQAMKDWSEGGANKIALHALVGGIMSDFGGSSFVSGAVGAGINEALQKELSNIKDPALHQWASALVGATASKVVGGNAQTGASTAVSGTKYNLQAHDIVK